MRATPATLLGELGLVPREEVAKATGRSVRSLKRDALLRRGPRPILYGRRSITPKSRSWNTSKVLLKSGMGTASTSK
jgi:hypothetical protein